MASLLDIFCDNMGLGLPKCFQKFPSWKESVLRRMLVCDSCRLPILDIESLRIASPFGTVGAWEEGVATECELWGGGVIGQGLHSVHVAKGGVVGIVQELLGLCRN